MGTTKLASNVSITSAINPGTSAIVSMGGANAINVQATVLSLVAGATTVNITVQGSDDMENWLTTGITPVPANPLPVAATLGNVAVGQYTTFGYAYARLLYSFGTQTVVLAVDVNTYSN